MEIPFNGGYMIGTGTAFRVTQNFTGGRLWVMAKGNAGAVFTVSIKNTFGKSPPMPLPTTAAFSQSVTLSGNLTDLTKFMFDLSSVSFTAGAYYVLVCMCFFRGRGGGGDRGVLN